MCLLDWMGCKTIPAVFTGKEDEDDVANTKLYLRLFEENSKQGLIPVLILKDLGYNGSTGIYGTVNSKESYHYLTKRLINLVKDGPCFDVWLGRLIYNYFLDYASSKESIEEDMGFLYPPDSDKATEYYHPEKYPELYTLPIPEDAWIMGKDKSQRRWDFSYEKCVFVLIPVNEPWEVLAWIPIGGFNNCPECLHQIAVAKGLYDLFGAVPLYIGGSGLEYYLSRPLINRADVEKAAYIVTAFDQDLYEDFWGAASSIRGKHDWIFWWD